jgi:hypothetical protein
MSDMQSVLRESIIEHLSKGEVELQFTKADGSIRKMLATRSNELIPIVHQPKDSKSTNTENLDIVKCFDLENDGWRSFRVDSLISYSVNGE